MGNERFSIRLDDGDITDGEAEAYAQGVYDMLLAAGAQCGHCKSYDPLTVDEATKTAHTYVFNLWDGGRHHNYTSLRGLVAWVRLEAYMDMWLDRKTDAELATFEGKMWSEILTDWTWDWLTRHLEPQSGIDRNLEFKWAKL